MDQLRRSFRDSFRRRRGENISEASRPQQWQSDEMDVRAGTCFFHVKYLGCVEVFESRGMQVCEEALRKLKNRKKRPIKAILYVSGDGLRVVENDTKGLIVDQTIEKVSFCAPDRNHERGFCYICRDGTTRRWLCHGFLSLRESGERLSHAVGCAFAVCLERKQKRDQECNVTMNFDVSSATFTRTGSFKQPLLTDRSQDTKNANINVVNTIPAAIVAAANNTATPSNNTVSTETTTTTTTVTGINNNIGINCDRKEKIPIQTPTSKISTKAIERPHASVSLLQRQGSFRGLSHLNHASPFKRQLSLRISDLPSNMERTRLHSIEYASVPPPKTLSQLSVLKTAVSAIPESLPIHGNDANTTIAVTANVADQVSAMCQQLSQGLSLLSNNDDLLVSTNDPQSNYSIRTSAARDLFAQKVNQHSSQLIELQPTVPQSTTNLTPSFLTQQQSLIDHSQMERSLLHSLNSAVTANGDANVINNNGNNTNISINNHNIKHAGICNNANVLTLTATAISSMENIPLTPPSTPPLRANTKLPRPDQWLGKVAQLTIKDSETVTTASVVEPCPSTFAKKTAMGLHTRAYSLSAAETALQHARIDEKPRSDPFNIDWASLAAKTPKPDGNTNPFLTNPCAKSDQQVKTFEVQM